MAMTHLRSNHGLMSNGFSWAQSKTKLPIVEPTSNTPIPVVQGGVPAC